jgi:hypothetical protein
MGSHQAQGLCHGPWQSAVRPPAITPATVSRDQPPIAAGIRATASGGQG